MAFSSEAYVFAFLLLVFVALFAWASSREKGFPRFLLMMIAVLFFSLSMFAGLTGLAYSVEYSNQADCEPVINSTTLTNNTTTYTYVDSCEGDTVPVSLSMLYVVYNYMLLFLIFVAVLSLMFIGLTKVILKW